MKIFKILLVAIFSLSLAGSLQAKVLYQDKFEDWRDEDTDPGFNAWHEVDKEKNILTMKTSDEINYGKIMSSAQGITLEIDENTELSVELLSDIPKGRLKVHVMTAGEPYDSHTLIKAHKKGTYRAKIAKKTPWNEEYTFWVEIWMEGFDRVVKIKNLKITDGQEKKVKAATKSKTKKITKKSKKSKRPKRSKKSKKAKKYSIQEEE